MGSNVTLSYSIVQASPDQVSCALPDELLLLHVPSGTFYGLNATAEEIWWLVQEPRSLEQLRDALLQRYDVEPEPCEQSVRRLLREMVVAGLVRTEAAEGPPAGAVPVAARPREREVHADPRLQRFGDRDGFFLWSVVLARAVALQFGEHEPTAAERGAAAIPSRTETFAPGNHSRAGCTRVLELLTCCARVELEPADVQRLRRLAGDDPDWNWISRAAQRHGLLPLLYSHLHGAAADLVPPHVLRSLREAFMVNAAATLELAGELQQVCKLFAEHNILAVPYKGPALAASLYGNISLRQSGDLDLLLPKADIVPARELLLTRGYRLRHELSAGAAEHLLRTKYHEVLDRNSSRPAMVELHWAFASRDLAVGLNMEELAPRLGTARLGGATLPAFCAEDLLLILCIHGSKHRWNRLEWICGVAELLREPSGLDWEGLLERAGRLGSRRMLLLGVYLAHSLLAAPVPLAVEEAFRSDRRIMELATRVRGLLLQATFDPVPHSSRAGGALWFRVHLQDRLRDKVRILAYHLTTPAVEEWRVLSFAGSIIPVHALYRPLNMLAKVGHRAYRNLLQLRDAKE